MIYITDNMIYINYIYLETPCFSALSSGDNLLYLNYYFLILK